MAETPKKSWRVRLALAGCAAGVFALLAGAGYTVARFPRLVWMAIPLLLVIPASIAARWWQIRRAAVEFRMRHGRDKDLLIVYSASPHWQQYIETNWLPRWSARAIVLNRSKPDWITQPEVVLWRHMTGPHNHTPAAIVIPRRGRPTVIRFYSAFRDNKDGKPAALQIRESELVAALAASSR